MTDTNESYFSRDQPSKADIRKARREEQKQEDEKERQGKQSKGADSEKPGEGKDKDKNPPGGLDRSTLQAASISYTVEFTFHSAANVPVADFGKRSSDPYILADLSTSHKQRHAQDPAQRFRSPTIHRTTEPAWNVKWIVGGVPKDGFHLKVRLMDEDSPDMDDKLGKVKIDVRELREGWVMGEQDYKVHKRGGDTKAYALRWCTSMMPNRDVHARLRISARVLGETSPKAGKTYTINNWWWKHYSPMIGKLAGTKANDTSGIEKANFQANELQLRGPVPNELYHRYVEFKPFVAGMFRGSGIRGRLLNMALHTQHARIYNFDPQTDYGVLPGPGKEMALRFLDMVHYDQGGRVFTYVITLDGMFRFTETGKEFGIDLLSKHTMHSDVNIYIAYSGEFLVRRLKKPDRPAEAAGQKHHPADDVPGGPPEEAPPKDPRHYELIIDNDSGTYRPDKSLLPVLRDFLKSNLEGLHVETFACDDPKLEDIRKEQLQTKGREGDHMVFGQQSDTSSISSSEAGELEDRAYAAGDIREAAKLDAERKKKKESAATRAGNNDGLGEGEAQGQGAGAASEGEVEADYNAAVAGHSAEMGRIGKQGKLDNVVQGLERPGEFIKSKIPSPIPKGMREREKREEEGDEVEASGKRGH